MPLSFVLLVQGCLIHRCHAPRKRGIQYAAAHRFKPSRLWNTGSPAFAGDDIRVQQMVPKRIFKHICARGRIALSGVGLRPQGLVGGSKKCLREVAALNAQAGRKSSKVADRYFRKESKILKSRVISS
jgi:hypothetical protein